MQNVEVKILLNNDGCLPQYKSGGASGADIFSAEDGVIERGRIKLVKTGIFLEIPYGYEMQIRPRSGLALKHGIFVLNSPGTIDSDYRGELMIILGNFGEEDFLFYKGDRIAQMVLSCVYRAEFNIVDKIDSTERGSGGFGHTGL